MIPTRNSMVLFCTTIVCFVILEIDANQFNYNGNNNNGHNFYPQFSHNGQNVYIPNYPDNTINQQQQYNNPTYPPVYPPVYPNPNPMVDEQPNTFGYPSYPVYPNQNQNQNQVIGAQSNTPIYSPSSQTPPMKGRSFRVTLMRGNINSDDPSTHPQTLYASVGFGTPPKQFNIQFDTSSSEIWIPHSSTWSFFKKTLHYDKGYYGSSSSTSTKEDVKYEFVYRGVKLEAKAYIDNLLFDHRINEHLNSKNLSNVTAGSGIAEHEVQECMATDLVQQQRFLAVSDASDSTFRYAPFDGVIGLAPLVRSSTGTIPFLVRARETATISHTVFSIYINPVLDSPFGGEITFGGINPARYTGQIFFHPVTSWFDWAVRLSGVQLGQQVVSCQHGCAAIFDTGLNDVIRGPIEDVMKMMQDYLGAEWDKSLNFYTIHCSRIAGLPLLVFAIDGRNYALLPTNYVRLMKNPSTGVEKCYINIVPYDTQNWILGTNFLGAYYTVFDMDQRRIGFATMNVS